MKQQKRITPFYTSEFRARGVRLFKEHRSDYVSDNAAYGAIASKLGCSARSLRTWTRQRERDCGERSGLTSEDKARIKALERKVRELRTANEILKKASAHFAPLPANAGIRLPGKGRSSTARFANDRVY